VAPEHDPLAGDPSHDRSDPGREPIGVAQQDQLVEVARCRHPNQPGLPHPRPTQRPRGTRAMVDLGAERACLDGTLVVVIVSEEGEASLRTSGEPSDHRLAVVCEEVIDDGNAGSRVARLAWMVGRGAHAARAGRRRRSTPPIIG
jgi:hypothetical protein